MDEVRKIKQLRSQLNSLTGDAEALKIEIANKQREYNQKLQIAAQLEEKIKKTNNTSELKVSEHALVRYFERVKGYDIAAIESEILSEKLVEMVDKLGGSGTFPSNGFNVIMKNFTVTTVIK